jgi:cytochrome P450
MNGITDDLTLDELDADLHGVIARLRTAAPVAWVPALGGWLVTRRDLVVAMMRDAETFTVDDPRFSTGRVVGPSMLSLDGPDHARHRDPFADAFTPPIVREVFAGMVAAEAARIVGDLDGRGRAELRRELAGPLAVHVVVRALGLEEVEASEVLDWYDGIVAAVARASTGREIDGARLPEMDLLAAHIEASIGAGSNLMAEAARVLSVDEVVSNAAVIMFGGIETGEGTTANAFGHFLSHPGVWSRLADDRSLIGNAVEESIRLEPAVVQVDRYATRDVDVGGAKIRKGDFVMLSIAGANRDPAVFADPDRFDIHRANARSHVTFAHGPHACIGIHLAKFETRAAITAALDRWPDLHLRAPVEPRGLVFRKPHRVDAAWTT